MLRLIFTFVLLVFAVNATAACNFTTANFLSELNNPKSIEKIEVRVPKSAKFARNFTKILISKSKNIPPELKKNFKAIVTVKYEFGSCSYDAKVKQNGDWKDHVSFIDGGQPLRSLNVKLKEGNILNAVKFKLLLPETRNNLNEVLGSVFMRELGFISPETFQVNTEVNGVRSLMLFQEDLRKELLERNNRREGPLFEGDENLLWSYEGFENFELESLALSRVSNDKWFLKGGSSQQITLSAYSLLQTAYLDYSQNIEARKDHIIFPNNRESSVFDDYFFALFAMNGMHALRPHNRRYYFNSFTNLFEPVYYDGNINLHEKVSSKKAEAYIINAFKVGYKFPYRNTFLDKKFANTSLDEFKNRVVISDEEAKRFFDKALSQTNISIESYQKKIDKRAVFSSEFEVSVSIQDSYLKKQKEFGVKQTNITLSEITESGFNVLNVNGEKHSLTVEELALVVSDNELKDSRYTLFPNTISNVEKLDSEVTRLQLFGGDILHSKNLSLEIDQVAKKIQIQQQTSKDWVLFRHVSLKNWSISFTGSNKSLPSDEAQTQRFNRYGMTGCLNFYQTKFESVKVSAVDGACEDSVNIVNSNGNLDLIRITRAYADAIDIDFSEVKIDKVEVSGAGNDCFDVSGGHYNLNQVTLSNCGDKGISVGEKSQLNANNLVLDNAVLGVSSKDFSEVKINHAIFNSVGVCLEAMQKKQEFGGARLLVESLECEGEYIQDSNSIILREVL
ncbi:hypothetical protein MED121_06580 [Marinomonas sp. MED121]|uniref:hypothetical protein n=1 Tax=Marinomonas sp. MED121 TaxID=314277 RepID=UPI00006903F6|nr:hypothetical protein [Marinomonas sp. MED121]EAQ66327.1 hypothetical protein MED121_06580 [Marinomonas sp. MED121]